MSFKVVQVSDTHLLSDRTGCVAEVPTWLSFRAVLDDIDERHGNFDLLVLTGDLAQDELEPTYAHLREGLGERLSRSRLIPGNHDDRPALRKIFPEFFSADAQWLTFAVDCGNWRVVGLDSQVTGAVHGALSAEQLKWLDDELSHHPQPHLIFDGPCASSILGAGRRAFTGRWIHGAWSCSFGSHTCSLSYVQSVGALAAELINSMRCAALSRAPINRAVLAAARAVARVLSFA